MGENRRQARQAASRTEKRRSTSQAATDTGGVLAFSEILARLENGEIFRSETWDTASIRAAAYDLRVANDFMILSGGVGEQPLVYNVRERRRSLITLSPGHLAYVSTTEKLCMPWDLAGLLSIKSSWARRGLLILGGQMVDPGFGINQSEERLHFLVMNIGARDVHLRPGTERIASLQLLRTCGEIPQDVRDRPVRGMQDAKERHFEKTLEADAGADLAMGFFNELGILRQQISLLGQRVQRAEQRLGDVQSGALPLITFGFVVLGLTFLGIILSTTLELASNATTLSQLRSISEASGGWPGLVGVIVAGVIIAACLVLGIRTLAEVLVGATKGMRLYAEKRTKNRETHK